MEFRFETDYDQKGLTAMARAQRLSVRKKSSRRVHVFGWCVVILGILLIALSLKTHASWSLTSSTLHAAVLVILITRFREDQLNARIAQRNLLPGTERAVSVFGPDGYVNTTAAAVTEFHYDAIQCVCETADHFVFFLGKRHGQLFDKSRLTGGGVEDFRAFITEKTGNPIVNIK